MHKILINKTTFQLPSSLAELNMEQRKLLLRCRFAEFTDLAKQTAFLDALLTTKQHKAVSLCNDVQFSQILGCLNWFQNPLTAKPLFEKFEFEGTDYVAPQEKMQSSCIAEFVVCDNLLQSYESDSLYLEKLTAVLFRPIDNAILYGDRRVKMNTDQTFETAKAFQKLDISYKLAALSFFMATKEYISDVYAQAFEEDGDGEDLGGGWGYTLMTVAETKTFGTLEDVKFTNLHEVLQFLVKKKKEYQAQKRHQEKANRR